MDIRTSTVERLRDALLQSGARSGPIKSSAYGILVREGLLTKPQEEALARIDAIAETMFLVASANGEVTDTELSAVRGAVRGLCGEVLTDGIIQAMIETYAVKLQQEGRPARLASIRLAMQDETEALNAFALAAAAALADDRLDREENRLILEIKEAFHLKDEQVAQILGQLKEDGV